jgi:hypothetical protein
LSRCEVEARVEAGRMLESRLLASEEEPLMEEPDLESFSVRLVEGEEEGGTREERQKSGLVS